MITIFNIAAGVVYFAAVLFMLSVAIVAIRCAWAAFMLSLQR